MDLRHVFIDCMKVDQNDVQRELDHECVEIPTLPLLLGTAVQPLEQGGVKLWDMARGREKVQNL